MKGLTRMWWLGVPEQLRYILLWLLVFLIASAFLQWVWTPPEPWNWLLTIVLIALWTRNLLAGRCEFGSQRRAAVAGSAGS